MRYPDIAERSQKLGLGPAERWPQWSLPIIEYEGTVVRGSFNIAKFPERQIVGEDCEKWQGYVRKTLVPAVWPMTGSGVPGILDERDEQFF